jgi:hypothetical protein
MPAAVVEWDWCQRYGWHPLEYRVAPPDVLVGWPLIEGQLAARQADLARDAATARDRVETAVSAAWRRLDFDDVP